MKNKKLIYLIGIFICMIMIFTFSSKNSNQSNSTSKTLINNGINIYESITKTDVDNKLIITKLNYPVRKLAHFSVYFLLGLLVYKLILLTPIKRKKIFAILICFTYAMGDEIHQLFVSGRTGQVKDIIIDTLGSITAIILITIISNKLRKTCKDTKNML